MLAKRRSRKKASEHKIYRWIISVVAAIAVVGLVTMFLGNGPLGLGLVDWSRVSEPTTTTVTKTVTACVLIIEESGTTHTQCGKDDWDAAEDVADCWYRAFGGT